MMNKQKTARGLWAALTLALVLGACASGPKQKTEILDDKGAALGIPTPNWVSAYVAGGNIAVEKLSEYKDFYCFVVSAESQDKPFVLAWVGNVDGPAQIAGVIATTVANNVAAREGYVEGEEHERAVRRNAELMSNSSFTGSRKVADWWMLTRNKATAIEMYQGYVLYTFGKKVLDDQIARNLQNIVDNNKAISEAERAIYADLINEIRVNGVQQS